MNELQDFAPTMSLNYVPQWGAWEVVRELTSNAKDTGKSFRVYKENNNLIVEDDGEGLAIRHLLFGETEKPDKNAAIGQFGEGLKLAVLVLTRMDKIVEIQSGNLFITNGIKEIGGVKTLNFKYREVEKRHGTKITVYDWEFEDYQDQFIKLDDDKILTSNDQGDILDDKKLYIKGVYVKDLPDYEFGYNLNNMQINRDRNAVSDYDMRSCIGRLWAKIESPEGWEYILKAIKNSNVEEKDIDFSLYYFSHEAKESLKTGWFMAFGKNAVLGTNKDVSREAEHRGAKVIDEIFFGYYFKNILKELIGTDAQYVKEKAGLKAYRVPKNEIDSGMRKNLSLLKKLGQKVGFGGEWIVANMPESLGEADEINNAIKIHPKILHDTEKSISIGIHELAHIVYDTCDTTDEHVNACTDIGAKLVMDLMKLSK